MISPLPGRVRCSFVRGLWSGQGFRVPGSGFRGQGLRLRKGMERSSPRSRGAQGCHRRSIPRIRGEGATAEQGFTHGPRCRFEVGQSSARYLDLDMKPKGLKRDVHLGVFRVAMGLLTNYETGKHRNA